MLPRAVHPYGSAIQNKESSNRRKSGPFQKCALFRWTRYATNAYIGHQFEPRSRLAHRSTGFRRISVRSTVSANYCCQRTNTTHHAATTRLEIASANAGRHHQSVDARNRLLHNQQVQYAGSGGNTTRSTSFAAFTTHGDTSSISTTPAATSDDRRARFRILVASAGVLGA
ncbi:MAG: hypothetical protein EZS28_049241, partial [Streblomastix strix]